MDTSENRTNIFEEMQESINKADIPEEEKKEILKKILKLKSQKLNIMITGATGSGKSSTINALFDMEVARVGIGVDPETVDIVKYDLENMTLWDTPGLGDSKEADNRHSKNIIEKLNQKDSKGQAVIDLVLVILDGSTRDLGTSYELINQVIIPNLGKEKNKRILVAINQCDVAMKGRYWDHKNNKPEPKLEEFLNEKVESIRKRILEGTGVDVTPIYYSAGFKEEGEKQSPYNLSKLLYFIIQHTPKEKRLVYVENISKDNEMWKVDDHLLDYTKKIQTSFLETVEEFAGTGADICGRLGSVFGETGEKIGRTVGTVGGAVVGIFMEVMKPRWPFRF